MKRTLLSAAAAACCLLACKTNQQIDQKKAYKQEQQAKKDLNKTTEETASYANGQKTAGSAIQMDIEKAMADVDMPAFKQETAKNLATKYYKSLSDLVNTNSGKKGSLYLDKMQNLMTQYINKADEQKLNEGDKSNFNLYAGTLINVILHAN